MTTDVTRGPPEKGFQTLPMSKDDTGEAVTQGQEVAKSCGITRDHRRNQEYPDILKAKDTEARPKRGHQALSMYRGDTRARLKRGHQALSMYKGDTKPQGQGAAKDETG